ncbi:MAG: hypothetical protein ACREQ9_20660, partial [Candidatus Binatia bacterium]
MKVSGRDEDGPRSSNPGEAEGAAVALLRTLREPEHSPIELSSAQRVPETPPSRERSAGAVTRAVDSHAAVATPGVRARRELPPAREPFTRRGRVTEPRKPAPPSRTDARAEAGPAEETEAAVPAWTRGASLLIIAL